MPQPRSRFFRIGVCAAATLLAGSAAIFSGATWAQGTSDAAANNDAVGGPIRLRQPPAPAREIAAEREPASMPAPYRPSDFELFVRRIAAQTVDDENGIRRLGAELVTGTRPDLQDQVSRVPGDYQISFGDEVLVTIWGSIDADLRLVVDRSGRVSIPRVGTVQLAGVTVAELPAVISQRVAQVFKNFQLSASVGQIRQIRIYVTGFTARPGAYSVGGLSTIVNALMRAGGPTAAGSLRNVELRRGGKLLTNFDFYDLIVRGDSTADRRLQPDDIVHIGAVGAQVGIIGSVNKPAVVELKAGETVADMLRMVGGFTAIADRTRLTVERLAIRNEARIVTVNLPQDSTQVPASGDVFRAFSAVDAIASSERPNRRVRIEGEVAAPGEYVLPPASSVRDALLAAGGLTKSAYLFGTELNRENVRLTQQENYERALRDLETEFTRATTTQRASSADEALAQASRSTATGQLITRLRAVRPSGRIVLQLDPAATELPDLVLEDGDRLFIPSLPSSVGVFGSVYNGGSYLFQAGKSVDGYVRLAGGPTRGADDGSVFVVRANGSVVSARQTSNSWLGGRDFAATTALPGDTIFVPEELNKTTFIQSAKEWTQILYQFGIGAAALKTLRN